MAVKDALTRKQRQFINEYMVDLNGTQAAIRAGYSIHTAGVIAAENLEKPYIREELDRLIEQRERRTKVTADYVLSTIQETIERCKQGEPVLDREGNETGEWKFDAHAILKGCELAGKHLKLFADRLELEGTVTYDYVDVSRLSDAELGQLERIVESACPTQGSKPTKD